MSGEMRREVALPRVVDIGAALSEALALLEPIGAGFALVGGLALAVYGHERFTKDVDFAVLPELIGAIELAVAGRDPRPLRIGGVSFLTATGVRVDFDDPPELGLASVGDSWPLSGFRS